MRIYLASPLPRVLCTLGTFRIAVLIFPFRIVAYMIQNRLFLEMSFFQTIYLVPKGEASINWVIWLLKRHNNRL